MRGKYTVDGITSANDEDLGWEKDDRVTPNSSILSEKNI